MFQYKKTLAALKEIPRQVKLALKCASIAIVASSSLKVQVTYNHVHVLVL